MTIRNTRRETLAWPLRFLVAAAVLQLLGCSPTEAARETLPPISHDSGAHAPSDGAGEPHLQSPIDLPSAPSSSDAHHEIVLRYHETMEHLIHREHTIELEYEPGSVLDFDGRTFELDQLHFHTPSEHLIGHQRFPVEMHLVHHGSDGSLLVLAVLFESGDPNPFIEQILQDAPRDVGRVDRDRDLSVANVIADETHFYAYEGSLTTPPYTEGVQWLILRDQRNVSPDQVVRLLLLEGGNARDVQPLNERPIEGD